MTMSEPITSFYGPVNSSFQSGWITYPSSLPSVTHYVYDLDDPIPDGIAYIKMSVTLFKKLVRDRKPTASIIDPSMT